MATPTKRTVRRIIPKDKLTEAIEPDGDEGDDDEAPRKPVKKAAAKSGEGKVRGGWTEGQKTMDSTSSFAQSLKLEEKSVIVRFLDDTPYANFKRHWIERTTKEGKSTRAYTCPTTIGEDCPLCEVGDKPQAVAAFNVALVGDDGQVLIKSWDVGPRLFNVFKAYANDPKVAPLTKGYFIASKTGKRGTVQHNVSPVSRTALREDYDIEPPSQEDFDRLVKYTPEIVDFAPKKTLRELAEELADEYE